MRNNLRALAVTNLSDEEREQGRTEVLPVQWRKHLSLDVRLSQLPSNLFISSMCVFCHPQVHALHSIHQYACVLLWL